MSGYNRNPTSKATCAFTECQNTFGKRWEGHIYCSRRCGMMANKLLRRKGPSVVRPCSNPACDKTIAVYRGLEGRKHCSRDCLEVTRSRKWKSRLDYILSDYRLTADEFHAMELRQNYLCKICGKPETAKRHARLSVDHDHRTGKVRELLCSSCNYKLGYLESDPEFCAASLAYLSKHASSDST